MTKDEMIQDARAIGAKCRKGLLRAAKRLERAGDRAAEVEAARNVARWANALVTCHTVEDDQPMSNRRVVYARAKSLFTAAAKVAPV